MGLVGGLEQGFELTHNFQTVLNGFFGFQLKVLTAVGFNWDKQWVSLLECIFYDLLLCLWTSDRCLRYGIVFFFLKHRDKIFEVILLHAGDLLILFFLHLFSSGFSLIGLGFGSILLLSLALLWFLFPLPIFALNVTILLKKLMRFKLVFDLAWILPIFKFFSVSQGSVFTVALASTDIVYFWCLDTGWLSDWFLRLSKASRWLNFSQFLIDFIKSVVSGG